MANPRTLVVAVQFEPGRGSDWAIAQAYLVAAPVVRRTVARRPAAASEVGPQVAERDDAVVELGAARPERTGLKVSMVSNARQAR